MNPEPRSWTRKNQFSTSLSTEVVESGVFRLLEYTPENYGFSVRIIDTFWELSIRIRYSYTSK